MPSPDLRLFKRLTETGCSIFELSLDSCQIGDGTVIKGIEEAFSIFSALLSCRSVSQFGRCRKSQGLRGMREGGIRQLYIPVPSLAELNVLSVSVSISVEISRSLKTSYFWILESLWLRWN